jgi:hypothetical protein
MHLGQGKIGERRFGTASQKTFGKAGPKPSHRVAQSLKGAAASTGVA